MPKYFSHFNNDYFFQIPNHSPKALYFWLSLYLVVFVGTLVGYFVLRKKGKTEKPYLSFSKKILWTNVPISIIGLFFVFARYENLRTFSWRFWQTLVFFSLIGVNIWIIMEYKKLMKDLLRYKTTLRKQKWLKKKK